MAKAKAYRNEAMELDPAPRMPGLLKVGDLVWLYERGSRRCDHLGWVDTILDASTLRVRVVDQGEVRYFDNVPNAIGAPDNALAAWVRAK